MPLATYALTSVADVKDQAGISPSDTSRDAEIEALINAASLSVIRYTGREFASVNPATTRMFPVNTDGTVSLYPYDLQAVSSVSSISGGVTTLLNTSEYVTLPYDTGAGGGYTMLQLSTVSSGYVSVTGSWGWTNIPSDIAQLVISTVVMWLRADEGATSPEFGGGLGAPARGGLPAGVLPRIIKAELEAWRVPVVA